MKYILLVLGSLFLFGLSPLAHAGPKVPKAKAIFYNSQGQKIGTAKLSQMPDGVNIALKVSKLPPGEHGFHVHTIGLCQWPDFSSAGPHFNPFGKQHGLVNPKGAHAGDMPNIVVFQNGKTTINLVLNGVTLEAGNNSLLQPRGTSLVIHANADDEKTDPSGNSGARIACGVIQERVVW